MALRDEKRFMEWPPAGFDGLFAWDFLQGAFGEKITPMDLDAVVERKGQLLIFETKNIGASIPEGQAITLNTLWKVHNATIFHIEGKQAGRVTGCAIYSAWDKEKNDNVGDRALMACNSYDVNYYAYRWFCRVEGKKALPHNEYTRELWLSDYDQT